jgi:hypothetical protein
MKKNLLMILALTAGALLNAETTQNAAQSPAQKPQQQVATANAAKPNELTAEEQAFVAKLKSEQNRKAYTDKLTVEQRKAVRESVKNGGDADEAVSKLASSHVASAEKAPVQAKK